MKESDKTVFIRGEKNLFETLKDAKKQFGSFNPVKYPQKKGTFALAVEDGVDNVTSVDEWIEIRCEFDGSQFVYISSRNTDIDIALEISGWDTIAHSTFVCLSEWNSLLDYLAEYHFLNAKEAEELKF